MWSSLTKLDQMPDATQLYCGHEYTLANGAFALTIEPGNVALATHLAAMKDKRAKGEWTLPTTLGLERAINPFLRAREPSVQAHLGMSGAAPAAVFAEIRERKNRF